MEDILYRPPNRKKGRELSQTASPSPRGVRGCRACMSRLCVYVCVWTLNTKTDLVRTACWGWKSKVSIALCPSLRMLISVY